MMKYDGYHSILLELEARQTRRLKSVKILALPRLKQCFARLKPYLTATRATRATLEVPTELP